MQDRVSLYPGRVKMIPVDGQENTYDMVRADQPTQEGNPLSKETFLKDATAALYGLDNTAVPDDIFAKIVQKAKMFRKLQQYETAGRYEFTVPDGISHIIAFIIGGGESGNAYWRVSSATKTGIEGGNSGGFAFYEDDVNSGDVISAVVGNGGDAVSTTTNNISPASQAGGSSSFGGVVANGGCHDSNLGFISGSVSDGAPNSIDNIKITSSHLLNFKINDIYPFYLMFLLYGENNLLSHFVSGGSGGPASYLQASVNFKNGKKSSGGAFSSSGAVTAQKGTDFGCGGGSAMVYTGSYKKATSAAGMNGVVAVWGY